MSKATAALVLIMLGTILVAARLHTYDEPLQTDITGAAVIGHELLAGRALYADMWDHKPPALHLTHAVAIALAGYGPGAVFLLNLLAGLVTLVGVYAAGCVVGSTSAGLWAAVFWTAISGDLWMQGNQPNAEVFINACVVWAFVLLLRADAGSGVGRFLAIGAIIAWGSLYKQIIVAPAAFLALAHVAAPPPGRGRGRALADVGTIVAVGVAAWATLLAYFAAVGRFAPFFEAVFTYNRHYTQHTLAAPAQLAFGFSEIFSPFLASTVPLVVLAILGTVVGTVTSRSRPWFLFLALVLGTPFAIWMPGAFAPHYYQLWLPALVIGSGWALGVAGRIAGQRFAWVPQVAGGVVLTLLLANQAPLYMMPADDWSLIKYGPIFVEERKLASELHSMLLPGETFYEWGSEVGLYYHTGLRPPTGAFSVWAVVAGPAAWRNTRRILADLEPNPPELFVLANWTQRWMHGTHPVLDWAFANYRPFPNRQERGPFSLYVLKGGKLEARLQRATAAK